jgi:hypothetical protein
MRTIQDMVRMETLCCMSALVSTIASGYGTVEHNKGSDSDLPGLVEKAFELCSPLDDYEEAAIQNGWIQYRPGQAAVPPDEAQEWWYHKDSPDGDWFNTAQECCEDARVEPYQREVFEHWAVTDWFARQLEAQGEKVDMDFEGLCIWARTTTGQVIYLDGVIEQIYANTHKPDSRQA